MPYVYTDRRVALAAGDDMEGPGDLNYLITRMILRYQEQRGLSYKTINDIVGALEGAKQEYYRRVAIPYENIKIAQNGDAYDKGLYGMEVK